MLLSALSSPTAFPPAVPLRLFAVPATLAPVHRSYVTLPDIAIATLSELPWSCVLGLGIHVTLC